MVDRNAREKMAAAVEDYLSEKTTAFALDDRITEIAARTDDETVKHVAQALWFHYDDCKDHRVVLIKKQWDYFQRLLLLLKSEASIRIQRRRVWSWRQVIAAVFLVGFCGVVIQTGFGMHLVVAAIPFGAISMALFHSRRSLPAEEMARLARLAPFASLAQVFAVRRKTPGFKKRPYPAGLLGRTIRSPFMSWLIELQFRAVWLIFSPVVLVAQLLPDRGDLWEVVFS